MLDIVFSSYAESALKSVPVRGNESPLLSAAVPFFEDSRKPAKLKVFMMKCRYQYQRHREWKTAVPLSGSREDVFGLYLELNAGDIAPEHFWEKRKELFDKEALFFPQEDGAEASDDAAQHVIAHVRSNLEKIYERAGKGEALRIWAGTSAEEQCMLSWFAAQLAEQGLASSKVYLNQLPEKYHRPVGGTVSCTSWAEVGPAMWGRLNQELCREAAPEFLTGQAEIWHRLQKENSELRLMENGILTSVPADYYDDRIRAEIGRQPDEFQEAEVIGRIIAKQLSLSDTWIAGRIETMITSGELIIAWEEVPGSRSYRRRLKKVKKI